MNIKDTYVEPEIQEYIDFFNSVEKTESNILTKKRVDANFDNYCEALNTFLVYPDIFADIMTPKKSEFSLFFAQRMVLRCMARDRQSFFTFTRSFSKSFCAFFESVKRVMLIPRYKHFITAGVKEQATKIAKEKAQDLWQKFPLLKREMNSKFDSSRKPYVEGSNYAEYRFSHGGIVDVVGGHPRGLRRNGGTFEEVIELDPIVVNEELIPLMNAPRTTAFGKINLKEPQAVKIFITTAGWQGTYSYDKCIETLCYASIDPQKYTCMGGSYTIPVMHGRLEEQTMREILSSPTYDRESIEREYVSRWSGSMTGSAFSMETVATLRKIVRAELKGSKLNPGEFYAISADMAKDGKANTAIIVFRVTPGEFMFTYKAVNLFVIDSSDYEVVANKIKQCIQSYSAKLFVYDANGIGASLRDWINKPTYCKKTKRRMCGYGIINPPPKSDKDIIKYNKSQTICFEIKTQGESANKIHKHFFSRISNGSVRFLIKSNEALSKFQKHKNFLEASRLKQKQALAPYVYMNQMESELKNIIILDTSDNISGGSIRISKRVKKIEKDFFSAAEYGIYGINVHFETEYYKKKTQKRQISQMFFT